MKTKILMAVSAFALMSTIPAYANTAEADLSTKASVKTEEMKADASRAWDKTKETVSNAADKVSAKTEETYDSIKAVFIDEDDNATETVTIDSRRTAKGMIGKSIHNAKEEKVGSLKDIIVDEDGDAVLAIVSDGGFLGIGNKLAAFDYNLVTRQDADGDIIAPLTEESVKKVTEFSYEASDKADKPVRTLPAGAYSVEKLLKANIVNPANEKVASVDNIYFREGEADQVIVNMGMGLDQAALDYDDLKIVRDGDNLNFQMSAEQAARFEAFKKTN